VAIRNVLEALNAGLHQAFASDPSVYLLGEDLLDPYGGAFKVARGLSSAYPSRVLTTPISEAGITGVASGMALRGLRPVVEIMFGDFTSLIADQVLNHLAKFRWMYHLRTPVPVVIRTPMGGRRGYGPTHSQSLEKHFLGVPGLHVLAPAALGSPGDLLKRAILETRDPVLFIENKLLYLQPLRPAEADDFTIETLPESAGAAWQGLPEPVFSAPCYRLRVRGAPPPQLTLGAYGHMASLAQQAVLELAYEHELFCELIVPTRLAPVSANEIIASAAGTGRLLALEEGTRTLGWGAEILARAAESLGPRLRAASRLAAKDTPIPASGVLEEHMLPGVPAIVQSALSLAEI
jgi:pyruvate/2-oxoglutarate/acetoin dehydrogenase E1 component